MAYDREEFFNLPVEEKLELVEALWDRIDDDLMRKKISCREIEEELDRRLSNLDKNPDSLIPWEEVKKEILKSGEKEYKK